MVSTSTRNSSTTRKRARFVIIPRETLLASRRIHHEARYYLERNTLKDVSGVFKDFEVFMQEGGILSDNPMVTSPKQWPLIVKKCSSFNVQIQVFICSARKWRTRLAHHDPMRYDFYERYINIRVELVFSSDILDIDDKGLVMNRDMVTLLPVGFNRETNKFWYSDANFERVDFLKRFMEFVRIARWMCESPAQRLLTKGYEHLKRPSLPHGHDVIPLVAHEAKHINIDNGRWSKEDDIAVTVSEITNSLTPTTSCDYQEAISTASSPNEGSHMNILGTIELIYTGTLRTPNETYTININPEFVKGPGNDVLGAAKVAWEWMNPSGDAKVSLKGCVDLARKMAARKETMMPRV